MQNLVQILIVGKNKEIKKKMLPISESIKN